MIQAAGVASTGVEAEVALMERAEEGVLVIMIIIISTSIIIKFSWASSSSSSRHYHQEVMAASVAEGTEGREAMAVVVAGNSTMMNIDEQFEIE